MNILADWGTGAAGVTLGLTLLHSLWEGAIAALALKLLLTVLTTARARYAASCVVMLALVAALTITMVGITLTKKMVRQP